jgi:hypothetical protein
MILALALAAAAAPTTVAHQGRLLDAAGAPVHGARTILFELYDAAEGGNRLWFESQSVQVTDGYYQVVLGNGTPLDEAALAGDARWLALDVLGSGPLETRSPLTSTPFALSARSLRGGPVDATEIRVNGEVVVGADGAVVDSLAGLTCADGAVASWDADAGAWACTGVVPTRGGGMHTLAIGGNTTLTTTFSHDIYTCGASQVVHVEAAITHWSASYRAAVDKVFYMDSYTDVSADTLLEQSTGAAGSWSFTRVPTGFANNQNTSNRLRITHNAGSYAGGANYYIFIRSTCPIYEM